MLRSGDRVSYNNRLGTVERRSPAGYVRVLFDDDVMEWFVPPAGLLTVVEGVAALKRHKWSADIEPICLRCSIKQTEGNEFDAC